MQEIIILGRGGQGAQTAGNLLAHAFFEEGQQVQTFATYGGARRGMLVIASLRVYSKPIRLRCNIENPTASQNNIRNSFLFIFFPVVNSLNLVECQCHSSVWQLQICPYNLCE